MTLQQLPLNVQLPANETFATLVAGPNEEAIKLARGEHSSDASLVYLWGRQGVGKSHLLHATCAAAQEQVMYLPLAELRDTVAAQVLRGLEVYPWLCLDDIDAVIADENWCFELFALLNRVRDQHRPSRVLVTACSSPAQLAAAYPDVQSRLSWGVVVQLHSLTDDDKVKALQVRAHAMGLELRDDAAQFMVQRLGRDLVSLIHCLERLDHASIAAQRKLTIPFVKAVLAI
ncbi:DnaA regulatory inactivator Hda [Pseudidiomarina terrestris]|uniref:DnaA regulatory inactivator Hda n=1 Tax=Pseudidiomarina terrestris TaxID=2820060 RepID=A0AAW7QW16_9GAMM|nr:MULTISPECIES: DnaA regulatory inactivator Hda [unclassified Pseudidiomarina]MDN7124093.1 DnaA regulatory inactivator Hda [Pseudidiomarina sp. 1APP75-32.1]MDN7128350.1 DnaA regulatory inactivator Hda [Pseudidiomarina sp. 1APR75-15]MDN7135422.1 DnaA regulatory inactivator Hda [Pseudidiomarina sp. 1ASP75-5]MDN7138546.1 DnaA regulatory inactivator Hda [Pseudidiomarina sp. 1ASP75-14]MEA3586840.1 DnaA regulatory inactivator Hda [Pseudidiomarina sp. 1APP75-27a]